MAKKFWIKKAISHPGAFKAKAQAAGMPTEEYADKVTGPGSVADTKTKRQANLAKVLRKFGHNKVARKAQNVRPGP